MGANKCPKCRCIPSDIVKYTVADKKFSYAVECYYCGIHTGFYDTQDEAIAKWNKLTKGENDED